ncbi:MAG: hypothetical protein VX492_05020 [Candidatus Thermoplasmatota archaeon]|nr:hypothetical protein [Candidatus Thermoplasmatota archaeon]
MSEIEACFYLAVFFFWALANYPLQTIFALFVFFWIFGRSGTENESVTLPWKGGPSQNHRSIDVNRSLSPSDVRSYDRLIDYMRSYGVSPETREEGIQWLTPRIGRGKSQAESFYSSPYVLNVLGLKKFRVLEGRAGTSFLEVDEARTAQDESDESSEEKSSSDVIGDDWWEEGYEKPDEKSSKTAGSSDQSCGHSGCSNTVTAFDFRCFTCRRRFCNEHTGGNIDCKECSS